MRIGPCTLLLAFSFAPALLLQTASAQAPAPVSTPAPACTCPAPTPPPQHVHPYSAKQTDTRVQTLADGTHITTVTVSQVWRDAEGRTRLELFSIQPGPDGAVSDTVSIYDPVARIRMNWSEGNPTIPKVVNLNRILPFVAQPAPPAPINPQPVQHRYYPYSSQSLPPQTIEGLYATGNRNTRTTPAGYEGNDRDITVTTELWTAPDLGITLRRISNDPRISKSTTELTDIQQTIPDPSLFKAPEGYEVKDITPTPAPSVTPACNCTTAVFQHYRFYIAMQRTTHVQTQADGTTITTFTPAQEWRDDVGRERLESIRTLPDGTQYRDDSVFDPVARVRMGWSVGKPNTPNVVTVRPFPQPVTQPVTLAPANPQPNRPYIPQRTESLPPQTIAGLYATGVRTTTTTPAGTQHNIQDIVATNETWTSPDTGIQLRWTWDDPQLGKSATEFTSIQFVNPDPAVFKAPEGYEVQERNPYP